MRPVQSGNAGIETSREQVQVLPVDTTIGPFSAKANLEAVLSACALPSVEEKELAKKVVAKFDKKEWMKIYMREHRKGILRRAKKNEVKK